MNNSLCVWLAMASLLAAMASGHTAESRIGFAEEFDAIQGWEDMEKDHPLAGYEAVDGLGIFKTWVGGLSDGIRPAGQPVSVKACSSAIKAFTAEVDLDKYHYVVMRTVEKSAMSIMYINKKEVHVACSTGVFAEDITPLGLSGKDKVTIELELMNCGNPVKIDYIRLVSSLSEEERKGLLPRPMTLRKEAISTEAPYQKLEALHQRAARPFIQAIPEEKVLFRDCGTGARMLRVTALPGDEGFSEHYEMWEPNGASFFVKQSTRIFYYEANKWARPGDKLPTGCAPRPKQYAVDTGKKKGWVVFSSYDPNTAQSETIHEVESPVKDPRGYVSPRLLGAIFGDEMLLVDPEEKDKSKMSWRVKLPAGGYKSGQITADGKYFTGNNPWGSYRKNWVDLRTGQSLNGGFFSFTHGMCGTPWSIMSYGGQAKLAIHEMANYAGKSDPGDLVRIFGIFKEDLHTDYGSMTSDGRYGITNGTGGELDKQHVAFDRTDPGTVLRLCTWRISRISWNLFTKTIPSPDYTKLALLSDMFGNGDYFLCLMRTPDAPRNLVATRDGAATVLRWEKPERCLETRGYNIYAATQSGGPFRRVNPQPVADAGCTVQIGDGESFFLVAAEEYSGLEGYFSNEATTGNGGRLVRHYEAEEFAKTLPMREHVDGAASGCRTIMIAKVIEGEAEGTISIKPAIKQSGDHVLWIRAGNSSTGSGQLAVATKAGPAGVVKIVSKDLRWLRSETRIRLAPEDVLTMTSADDGLAVDKVILTNDEGYSPSGCDDRKGPLPAVAGLKVTQVGTSAVELSWQPCTAPDLYLYSVYVSEKPDFAPGNETILCTTEKTTALDWGIKPGTKYHYKVTAIDKRWNESPPAQVEAETRPIDVVTIEIPATQAQLSARLRLRKAAGMDCIDLPKESVPADAAAANGDESMTFEFDVAVDGLYYFWGEFSPRHTAGRRVGLFVDGKDLSGWGGWSTREPFRLGRNEEIKPGEERWFTYRMCGRTDAAELKAGKHKLTLTLNPKQAGQTPLISRVWISNDAAFVAPGYNCQERFNDLKRQPGAR